MIPVFLLGSSGPAPRALPSAAKLIGALALLTAFGCTGAHVNGTRGVAPDEIAAYATARTPELLTAMNRTPHQRPITQLDSFAFGAPSPQNPDGMQVLRYRLDNGLEVLLLEDRSVATFAYQTWFRVGSRHERLGRTGIAHLFEHLMFKETRNLEEGEFDHIMESHGAETNAATWLDWTMYREDLPAADIELAIRLEADRIENMVLNKEQLESERDVVKNERRYRVDNDPEGAMFELLYATAYTEHAYGWPTIGWMKDIEAITLEDCLAFYKTYYAPNNAVLVIVGNIDPAETLALVNAYYGHLNAQVIPEEHTTPEPPQHGERRKLIAMPISSPKVLYGYHIPALTDPEHAAVELLHTILFGGRSARLYKRLITDLEWVTDTSGWVGEFAQPALYELLLNLKPEMDVERVEAVVDEELVRLGKEPIPEAELQKAKNQLQAEYLRNMQEVGDRAYGLGHYATTAGDFKLLFELTDRYDAVTAEDVARAARTFFQTDNRTTVVAMPRP